MIVRATSHVPLRSRVKLPASYRRRGVPWFWKAVGPDGTTIRRCLCRVVAETTPGLSGSLGDVLSVPTSPDVVAGRALATAAIEDRLQREPLSSLRCFFPDLPTSPNLRVENADLRSECVLQHHEISCPCGGLHWLLWTREFPSGEAAPPLGFVCVACDRGWAFRSAYTLEAATAEQIPGLGYVGNVDHLPPRDFTCPGCSERPVRLDLVAAYASNDLEYAYEDYDEVTMDATEGALVAIRAGFSCDGCGVGGHVVSLTTDR